MVRPTRRSSLLGRRLIFVPTSKSVAPPSPLFYIYVYSLVTNDITVHSRVTRFLSLLSAFYYYGLVQTTTLTTLLMDRFLIPWQRIGIHICLRIRQGEERERERERKLALVTLSLTTISPIECRCQLRLIKKKNTFLMPSLFDHKKNLFPVLFFRSGAYH